MATLKPPFRADDMDGLYRAVIKGAYSKIGNGYSKQLSGAIKMMLQVNPANRPDANSLLNNIMWKAEELGVIVDDVKGSNKDELLKTIRAHKNLHFLTERLPKSNYENGYEVERTPKSTAPKHHTKSNVSTNNSLRGLNLPPLDRLIMKNNQSKLPVVHHDDHRRRNQPDNRSLEGMLKIEGRNHHRREDYEEKNRMEKDIKAELRKIYNLRSSPKRGVGRRIVELPRIK